ncbi:MAG: hypothetical protein WBC70_11785 [Candidatus Aminicenantales bacterium]
MRRWAPTIAILFILTAGLIPAGQETPPQDKPPASAPDPLFVRLTFYPTASLSRYDYNNDIDLYEVRAYAEIRLKSEAGEIVRDARVTVLSHTLDYQKDHYEKRIFVDRSKLPGEVDVLIAAGERPVIRRTFPLPFWLVLVEPRPAIVDPDLDLTVKWRFSAFSVPVDVRVYDFKTGDAVFSLSDAADTSVTVPADKIPGSTTLRTYVISSWLSKRFLTGEEFVRGSEVNIIPWSQVFIRTQ